MCLVVPANPDEFIGSATKEMNVSGNKLWGVMRLLKELLRSFLKKECPRICLE